MIDAEFPINAATMVNNRSNGHDIEETCLHLVIIVAFNIIQENCTNSPVTIKMAYYHNSLQHGCNKHL